MRVLLQRVRRASVSVQSDSAGGENSSDAGSSEIVGEIQRGLLLLAGAGAGDTVDDAMRLAKKCAHLRIFEDDAGRMNHSVMDVGGACLVVSQFTLYADCKKGRRPFFGGAMAPDPAQALVEQFGEMLRGYGLEVQGGKFGAMMQVELVNDGPVTIWLDSRDL